MMDGLQVEIDANGMVSGKKISVRELDEMKRLRKVNRLMGRILQRLKRLNRKGKKR